MASRSNSSLVSSESLGNYWNKLSQFYSKYEPIFFALVTIIGVACLLTAFFGFIGFGASQGWWPAPLGYYISKLDAIILMGGSGCFTISCIFGSVCIYSNWEPNTGSSLTVTSKEDDTENKESKLESSITVTSKEDDTENKESKLESSITFPDDIHKKYAQLKTILHIVVSEDRYSVLQLKKCIENGADVKSKDELGNTPLHLALANNKIDKAKALIELGAPLKVRNNRFETPLHSAAQADISASDLKFLINTCRDLITLADNQGDTALHHAARYGKVTMIRCLDEAGAKMSHPNKKGLTPLHIAANVNEYKAVSELVRCKAEIDPKSSATGETPLMTAVRLGYIEAAKELVENGADASIQDNKGNTALHHFGVSSSAVDSEKRAMIQHLVKAKNFKTALTMTNRVGKTPLECMSNATQFSRGYTQDIGKMLGLEG